MCQVNFSQLANGSRYFTGLYTTVVIQIVAALLTEAVVVLIFLAKQWAVAVSPFLTLRVSA